MAKFKYVMTIPSIDIRNAISIKDLILVGSEDERYRRLKEENSLLAKYLESFRTPFGIQVSPSIIIRDASLPKVAAEDLCCFRNAIAVPYVIASQMVWYLRGDAMGYCCTDLFDFYPISVSSDGGDLSIRTPYEAGWGPYPDSFTGQVTYAVAHPENLQPVLDDSFMHALLDLLETSTRSSGDVAFRNRVLRSLEIAYYALRSPFVHLTGKVDFGVPTTLWVAAFERLAHPGNRNVRFSDVSSLIKDVSWLDQRLRKRNRGSVDDNFAKKKRGKSIRPKTTLPVQVYGRLYFNRNKYAHGAPIPDGRYEYVSRKGWGRLVFQVPALYRCVLEHLLASKGIRKNELCEGQCVYEAVLLRRDSVSGAGG
ncbi:MAG: hypothetical protein JW741_06660 [Sedimentisphaerales bacterium]|nr:hypothetical protein [Sedimentisphaerales bacterium]